MTGSPDFQELADGVRRGDDAARSALVDALRAELQAFVTSRMGAEVRRRVEPEDVVQDSLLTFFARFETFPVDADETQLRSFLFQIAKWKIADVLKHRRGERGESAAPSIEVAAAAPSAGPVTVGDEQEHMRRLIDRLGEPHASVLRLCVLDGQGTAAAAEALGVSEAALRKRLSRAREQLSALLGER